MVNEQLDQVAELKRAWNLAPVLQIQKIPENIAHAFIYQLTQYGRLMSCGSKDIFKNAPCLCSNTHRDITDLVNYAMVKNTKI